MFFGEFNTWTTVAWTVALAWVAITVIILRAMRNQSSILPTDQPLKSGIDLRLSVIVPARNESSCIEKCIRSLFRQNYPDFEVVAVNDRSTDDTGEILDRLVIEFNGRLRVVHVSNLPAGWFGKPNALNLGLRAANGKMVCFTDSDCEFLAPTALSTTVAELDRRQLDIVSVSARYTMTTLRECVAVPCCSEVLLSWLRPERIEDPSWDEAFANGAFILVRRSSFERFGGWGAVRAKISEDLEMARTAKRSGLRVGVVNGEGFYTTNSYGTLRDSWNGWSRIFKGALTPSQLIITVSRMLILFVLPLVGTAWSVVDAIRSGSTAPLTQGAGLAFLIAFSLRCVIDVAMFRLMGSPAHAAVFAPLGRLYVMAISIRALFSHLGLVHTHWRGTTFSAGQLVMPQPVKTVGRIR